MNYIIYHNYLQIKHAWKSVVMNQCELDRTQNDIFASAMGINRQIYLDSLLSPQFFSNSFKRTFGTITYYLEKIGMYFACFLCLKFIIDIVVAIVRAFELHTISNKTLGFWKIMLGAT